MHPQPESYWGNVNPVGPRSVYDEAKRFAEALTMATHRAQGLDVGIVRIFNTYGPRLRPGDGRVVSNFLVQAIEGRPLTVYGDGSQTRSLCFVDDEVAGILALLDSTLTGPVNIGNPDELTVLDLAHAVLALTGSARRRSSTSPCPPTTPPVGAPTSPWPAVSWVGAGGGPGGGLAPDGRILHLRHPARGRGSAMMDDVHGADLSSPTSMRVGRRLPRSATSPPPRRSEYRTLSVIVPVFNERNTVAEILRRIRAVDLPMQLEVVVVDDGSTDGTDKVLSALQDSTVRVVTHPTNQGKGAAVRTGVEDGSGRARAHPGRRPRVRPR